MYTFSYKLICVSVDLFTKGADAVVTSYAVADTGGLQWFQLQPPLKEHTPLISND